MSSLGFTNNIQPRHKIPKEVIKMEETIFISKKSTKVIRSLILMNALLSCAHFSIFIYICTIEFQYPLTFFYTRLNEQILNDFSCIFDYGSSVWNASYDSFCDDPSLTQTGTSIAPLKCMNVLTNLSSHNDITNGGNIIGSYELTRFGRGSAEEIDETGRVIAKAVLLAIEFITACSHFFYMIIYIRVYYGSEKIENYILSNGGVPLRWIEYSFTAALMQLFIANISNLFEVFGVVSMTISTFALTFFGLCAERLLAQQKLNDALILIYIPGFLIFISNWLPIVNSIATDVFRLSCNSYETDSFFTCKNVSCFGKQIPIHIFSSILFLLFAVFPLIILLKCFLVSHTKKYIDKYSPKYLSVLVNIFSYFMFIIISFFYSLFVLVYNVLSPVFNFNPKAQESQDLDLDIILFIEIMFGIASATSKIFLALFFSINFAERTW